MTIISGFDDDHCRRVYVNMLGSVSDIKLKAMIYSEYVTFVNVDRNVFETRWNVLELNKECFKRFGKSCVDIFPELDNYFFDISISNNFLLGNIKESELDDKIDELKRGCLHD